MTKGPQFLFGKVQPENRDPAGNYYVHTSGAEYYFALTTDAEHIYLQDTCGRYVPVDLDFLEHFALAVDSIAEVIAAYQEVDAMLKARLAAVDERVAEFKESMGE